MRLLECGWGDLKDNNLEKEFGAWPFKALSCNSMHDYDMIMKAKIIVMLLHFDGGDDQA